MSALVEPNFRTSSTKKPLTASLKNVQQIQPKAIRQQFKTLYAQIQILVTLLVVITLGVFGSQLGTIKSDVDEICRRFILPASRTFLTLQDLQKPQENQKNQSQIFQIWFFYFGGLVVVRIIFKKNLTTFKM